MRILVRIGVALSVFLCIVPVVRAADVMVPSGGPFGMVGITPTEIVRLGLLTDDRDACTVSVGFTDSDGNFLAAGPKALHPGSTQFLDLDGSQVVTTGASRMEVRPVFVRTSSPAPAGFPPGPCRSVNATVEVFERGTNETSVTETSVTETFTVAADSPGWGITPEENADSPGWGITGITTMDTIRFNVVSDDTKACTIGAGFTDSNGNTVNSRYIALQPGQAGLLDVAGTQAVPRGQLRVELRPFTTTSGIPTGFPPGPCKNARTTVEVFDPAGGQTDILLSR